MKELINLMNYLQYELKKIDDNKIYYTEGDGSKEIRMMVIDDLLDEAEKNIISLEKVENEAYNNIDVIYGNELDKERTYLISLKENLLNVLPGE